MTRDEIGKWPILFPLNKTKGELADIVVKANKDIEFLLSECKKLETTLDITAGALEGFQGVVRELEENELCFPTLAEFSNLQEDYEKSQTRIKELEEVLGVTKGKRIYKVERLFLNPEQEIKRLIFHLDLAISSGREGWKKVEQLENRIEDILSQKDLILFAIQKQLEELIAGH